VIDPTEADIGRKVVYRERGTHEGRKIEEGVLTSFKGGAAFVRYGAAVSSCATDLEDLEWMSPSQKTGTDQALDAHHKIEDQAYRIARNVNTKVALICENKPEAMMIMLEAVQRKIMTLRHEAERKAAGIVK
jgi:hypothetical protein